VRPKGRREKTKDKGQRTEVTYIRCSAKQKAATYFILFLFLFFLSIFCDALFGRFVKRGVKKTRETNFEKIHLGSSQKMWLFFVRFFFFFFLPRLFGSIFFNRVFGRFVTRGVQKRD
jgi:hypothetical protein